MSLSKSIEGDRPQCLFGGISKLSERNLRNFDLSGWQARTNDNRMKSDIQLASSLLINSRRTIMKKQFVAAFFLGLGLVSTNSLSGYAYQNHSDISTVANSQVSFAEVELNNNLKDAKFQKANTNSSFQVARAGRRIYTYTAHLKNNAGYVVRYIFQYTTNENIGGVVVPMPKIETGTLSLGFSKKFTLHREAKDFTLKVQPVGRGDFVIDRKLSVDQGYYCFSTEGTIFNPSYTQPRLRGTYQGPKCEGE
jgi:hypothetical protein